MAGRLLRIRRKGISDIGADIGDRLRRVFRRFIGKVHVRHKEARAEIQIIPDQRKPFLLRSGRSFAYRFIKKRIHRVQPEIGDIDRLVLGMKTHRLRNVRVENEEHAQNRHQGSAELTLLYSLNSATTRTLPFGIRKVIVSGSGWATSGTSSLYWK